MNVTCTRLQHKGCESAVCMCTHVYAALGGNVCVGVTNSASNTAG